MSKLTRRKSTLKPSEPKVQPLPDSIPMQKDRIEGMALVALDEAPDHPVFRQPFKAMTPPDTFFRFDPERKVVTTYVTVMPDKTQVVWWTCGACASHMAICRCPHGPSMPRSIEYIYDQIVADMAHEDWSIHHPNYNGSFRKALRGVKGPRWSEPTPAPRKALTRRSSASEGTPEKRSLSRKKPPAKPVQEPAEFDIDTANKAAAQLADELTEQISRRLTRKTEPNSVKRSLTRKKNRKGK